MCPFSFPLYGKPDKETEMIINNLIKDLKLDNYVFLKGMINNEDVPKLLMNAYMLLSSQRNTVRIKGGLSTKLGEYLASGVPTLVTNVGSIQEYIENGKHVFMVEPDNLEAFVEKMEYIINNYENALEVASKGRSLILNNYSEAVAAEKILKFIKHFV